MCFVWKFVLASNASLSAAYPILGLYELAPGFFFSFVVTVAVSMISKKPGESVCNAFERVSRLA